MAAPSKIVDEAEAIRWYEEGVTYPEFVERYLEKYNVPTSISMWNNWRRRRGLQRRTARDADLIPWKVDERHKRNYHLAMLRQEARRRAGLPVSDEYMARLISWKTELESLGAVVTYEPKTIDGFFLVPRIAEDQDIIREPAGQPRRKGAVD